MARTEDADLLRIHDGGRLHAVRVLTGCGLEDDQVVPADVAERAENGISVSGVASWLGSVSEAAAGVGYQRASARGGNLHADLAPRIFPIVRLRRIADGVAGANVLGYALADRNHRRWAGGEVRLSAADFGQSL